MSTRRTLLFVLLPAAALFTISAACCGIVGLGKSRSRNNARCQVCGTEFYVNEEWRGNIAQYMQMATCPHCGNKAESCLFFSDYDKAHPKK